jgi:hypothetical protein
VPYPVQVMRKCRSQELQEFGSCRMGRAFRPVDGN